MPCFIFQSKFVQLCIRITYNYIYIELLILAIPLFCHFLTQDNFLFYFFFKLLFPYTRLYYFYIIFSYFIYLFVLFFTFVSSSKTLVQSFINLMLRRKRRVTYIFLHSILTIFFISPLRITCSSLFYLLLLSSSSYLLSSVFFISMGKLEQTSRGFFFPLSL